MWSLEAELLDSPLVAEWLAEVRRTTTRETYRYRFINFLKYFNITPEQLLGETPKQARTLCLRYQNENPDIADNTKLGVVSTVSSFFSHHDKPINWKQGQKLRPRGDFSSHIFSNGDLNRMFEIADVRDKAILALATSLGWEISGFVDLKKETLTKLLARQEETGEQFIYFKDIRAKTGVPRLGVVNPLAIEWLRKWLKISKESPKIERQENSRRITGSEKVSDVFDLTGNGIRYAVDILAKKAHIKLTGRVRFHNLRKWTMAGLSRSGFNEFEVKYCVGKSIPMSDFVYLTNIEDAIKEKYPTAYENYLNLNPTVNPKALSSLSKELEKKTEEIEELKSQLSGQRPEMLKLREELDELRTILKKVVGEKS